MSFVHADAQTNAFAPASFDFVASRFGVMFFADFAAAFANLRVALKPGGRIGFVCWRFGRATLVGRSRRCEKAALPWECGAFCPGMKDQRRRVLRTSIPSIGRSQHVRRYSA